jgi:CRP-like cAMP-binding protein
VQDVLLVCDGAAAVEIDGQPVRVTSGLEFLGEVSFLTHDVASATVRVAAPMRALAWSHDALRALLRESLAIRFALRSVMSGDLARKLKESGPRTQGNP